MSADYLCGMIRAKRINGRRKQILELFGIRFNAKSTTVSEQEPISTLEMCDRIGMWQGCISPYMSELRKLGIVKSKKVNGKSFFSLTPEAVVHFSAMGPLSVAIRSDVSGKHLSMVLEQAMALGRPFKPREICTGIKNRTIVSQQLTALRKAGKVIKIFGRYEVHPKQG